MSDDNDASTVDKPHLLVVDDSRLMRRAIGKILGKDYRITEATDGNEAWSILQKEPDIAVIFSDLSMPNLDGFGLLNLIRESDKPEINTLPVIIITGAEDDDETKHKALNNGASDFISKPFESVQLRTRAKTHVKLDRTHKKLNETTTALETQTTTDLLTGLNNKKYFDTRIVKDLSYAKRHRGELSLVFLEIEGFHDLFLKYGKETADSVLQRVAKISRSEIRNEDTLARIGLAKLGYILPSTNRIGARKIAERVSEQLKDISIQHQGNNLPVIVNIGIAAVDINATTSVDSIIAIADRHLQDASTQPDSHSTTIEDKPLDEQASQPAPPLETLPDINTAIDISTSNEAERLQPYLSTLLKKLLPLLKLCNAQLKLGIDDAITKIEKQLK